MLALTIFTPTYNRADKIKKTYESLVSQTVKDFEWIIVDDGSSDNTEDVVETLIKTTDTFPIRYFRQSNHGKHAAINKGVQEAQGEAFFIVDSDDWLPEDSVQRVLKLFSSIKGKQNFAGVSGVKLYEGGGLVGTTFEDPYVDCTSLERSKYNITGDKSEIFYTDVLRKFPFPVFPDENFITENIVWYRIAANGYKIRWTNEPVYFCEYQPNGLTNSTGKWIENFQGAKLVIKEQLHYKEIPFKEKIKKIGVCGGCALIRKENLYSVAKEIECSYLALVMLGYGAYFYKKMKDLKRKS